jgi:4-cresol dehydrogenase (hydroxylating)
VRRVVEAANKHGVPLHPISRGRQHGLGMATAVAPGYVTVDLARMNRILEYDPELGIVVIEPGVTFAQLYEHLRDLEAPYWISPISGPVDASVLGNALDKGAGYTPLGNHFQNLIGLEVVLGDGRVLVTGDGALSGAKTLYTHKGGCGPMLDQLFAQSNYGIVTRAGVWLMPAPPAARGFVFSFPEYEDVERAVDVAGRLKLTGAIPSTVSIANDQLCVAVATTHPFASGTPGRPPLDESLPELREQYGVGAWNVVGCLYGAEAELEGRAAKLHDVFAATGAVRYLAEEEAAENKAFAYRFSVSKGIPDETELDVYNLQANGSSLYFLPSVPFLGRFAHEAMALSRGVCSKHGFAYTTQFLCSPRSMRNTQPIVFDSADDDARARVRACFGELIDVFHRAGYLVSRAPTHFQEDVMRFLGLHAELASGLKRVFDPNGIIDPGRYGIR